MGLKSRNQLERVISASLISQIWLVCSRMFPSRFPTTHKCRICGVDVETTEVRAHYRTTHPEFEGWGNHWKRLSWLLLISDMGTRRFEPAHHSLCNSNFRLRGYRVFVGFCLGVDFHNGLKARSV